MPDPRFPSRAVEGKRPAAAPASRARHSARNAAAAIRRAAWSVAQEIALSWRPLLCVLLIVLASALLIPYDADEFYAYHPILCRYYPGNALNVFRAGCSEYDLDLLGTGLVLPLRSYYYSGSFPSLYYLPVFLLWRSPLSARLVSTAFLAVQAAVLSRLFNVRRTAAFGLLLAFFPYAFQHVVDTGPVALHTTSVFLLYHWLRRWSVTLRWRYPLLCAAVVFACVWTKLVYLALVPGLLLLACTVLAEQPSLLADDAKRRILLRQSCVALGAALAPLALLFLSTKPTDPGVHPFLFQLTQGSMVGFSDLTAGFGSLPAVRLLLHPLTSTNRIFNASFTETLGPLYALCVYLAPPVLAGWAAWKLRLPRAALPAFACYAAFAATVLVFAGLRETWAMHHLVLAFPFLILSAGHALELLHRASPPARARRRLRALAMIFVACNAVWFIAFPLQRVRLQNDPSKERVNAVLADKTLAEQYLYVVTDWSMYFYQGLYGDPAQSVLYVRPLKTRARLTELEAMAAKQKRKLAFVVNAQRSDADIPMLLSVLRVRRCAATAQDAVWQVLLEDPVPAGPCGR